MSAALPVGSAKLTGALIGTVGSYQSKGNTIANAVDGNTNTFFDAPAGVVGWMGLDLGTPQNITQVQFFARSGFASRMNGGAFQGSTTADFSSGVTTLASVNGVPAGGVYNVKTVNATTAYQYVRYLSPVNGAGNVAEVEFDGFSAGPTPVPPPPPAAPSAPGNLTAVAINSSDVHLAWQQDPSVVVSNFTIARQGPADADFVVIGTTTSATSFDDVTVAANTSYTYEVIANNGGGASSPATPVSALTPAAPVNPWTDGDIGAVGKIGSSKVNPDGTILVSGGGADIWNQTDAFHYDYQPMTGNGSVTAQVLAQTNTNNWAKSGVMIRETANADSRFVDLALTPGNGVTLQSRTATHSTPNVSITVPAKAGVWLKLVRTGSSFSGYISIDNTTWTLVGTVTIPMVNNVTAGLCVTAHDNSKLGTAKFSNVQITAPGAEASAWSNAATAPMNRWESQSFTYNNELYIFGGFIDRSLNATTECDAYNPATNTWRVVTSMPNGALTHAATTVVGDTVYFAGGNIGQFADKTTGVCVAAVQTYSLTTGVWGSVASLPAPISCGGMVCVNNQLIYYGGLNANNTVDLNATWSLDLTDPNASWTAKAAMPNARNHIAYEQVNGIVYAIGGQHLYKQTTGNDAEVDAYNPITNVWTKVASLPAGRGAIHTTTLVVNGKIVIVGGQTNGGYDGIYSNNIEEYDPTTNTWTAVGTLPEANEGQSVAYINGQLIVADGTVDNLGGWSQNQTLINSEIVL